MWLDQLVIEDPSPTKMTRFANRLWTEHPEVIALLGEENIAVDELPPTVGGDGRELVSRIEMNLSAKFYQGMDPAHAEAIVSALIVIRQLAISVGIVLSEQVDDFLTSEFADKLGRQAE